MDMTKAHSKSSAGSLTKHVSFLVLTTNLVANVNLDPKIHSGHVFERKLFDIKATNQTKSAAGIDVFSHNVKLGSKSVKWEGFFGNKIAVDSEGY